MTMMDKFLEESKPLKELLGGSGSLFLTSSGAEATTQVLMSHYFDEARLQGKNQFITSESFLEDLSCVVTLPEGDISSSITPRTALVSVAYADSTTGLMAPVKEMAVVCRQAGVALHVDVTAAISFMPIDLDADFLSLDGKAFGVLGLGALLAKKPLRPLIYGERQFNPELVQSFCKAALHAQQDQSFTALETQRLRKRFEKQLKEAVPRAAILFEEEERLPHISYVNFSRVHPDALVFRLAHRGIKALEGPQGVSFSFTATMSADEIEEMVSVVKEEVALLALISEGL